MSGANRRYIRLSYGELGRETNFYEYTEGQSTFLDISIQFTTITSNYHGQTIIKIANFGVTLPTFLIGKNINIYAGYIVNVNNIANSPGFGLIGRGICQNIYRQPLEIGTVTEIFLQDWFSNDIQLNVSLPTGTTFNDVFATVFKNFNPEIRFSPNSAITGKLTANLVFGGVIKKFFTQMSNLYGILTLQKNSGIFTITDINAVISTNKKAIKIMDTASGMMRTPMILNAKQCLISSIIRADINADDILDIRADRFGVSLENRGVINTATSSSLGLTQNFQGKDYGE